MFTKTKDRAEEQKEVAIPIQCVPEKPEAIYASRFEASDWFPVMAFEAYSWGGCAARNS